MPGRENIYAVEKVTVKRESFPHIHFPLALSLAADLILAFLIIFALVQSCSWAAINIFIDLLIISAVLGLSGLILSLTGSKVALAEKTASLLLIIIYIVLLVILYELAYL